MCIRDSLDGGERHADDGGIRVQRRGRGRESGRGGQSGHVGSLHLRGRGRTTSGRTTSGGLTATSHGTLQSLHLLHLLCAVHQAQQGGLLNTGVLLTSGSDLGPISDHLENRLVRFRPNRETRKCHLKEVDCLPHLRHGVCRHTGVAGTRSRWTGRANRGIRHW